VIGSLEGRLLERGADWVLLDVGGVGYEVQVPLSTLAELPADGKQIRLRIHTHVREDALQLFGFASPLERTLFRLLIGVSKIGPRLALAILSGVPAPRFIQAVRGQDLSALRGVPGVGSKTAERIAMELRDKLDGLAELAEVASPRADLEGSALSALLNLGYTRAHAERAVQAARERLGEPLLLESLVREALRIVAS
jgi:Holliday junction DNA helicase RuvA